MRVLQSTIDTLSPLRLYGLDRARAGRYVTACLKAQQKGENGSPTETVWKIVGQVWMACF